MEIKAKRDELLATLYWTQSIVERRNTMPILGNVLIEAQIRAGLVACWIIGSFHI